MTLFTVLLTSRIIEPLERLARFARELGRGRAPAPLPIEGPKEIQEVNESFNVMVQDLKRLANDREVLLAGVSHDLRTPITRLRLEVELAPLSEETRDAMCSDLDQMENIVKQFMAYVREGEQPLEVVNFSQTVLDAIASEPYEKLGGRSALLKRLIRTLKFALIRRIFPVPFRILSLMPVSTAEAHRTVFCA